jgi:hypothetical protein
MGLLCDVSDPNYSMWITQNQTQSMFIYGMLFSPLDLKVLNKMQMLSQAWKCIPVIQAIV